MRKRSKSALGGQSDDSVSASSLVRGLEILRAFRASDPTLSNFDLMERTGLPKATVSRLTYALVNMGYLIYQEELGRYSIGPSTVTLGYSALSSMPVVKVAQPLLQRLVDRTGVAAALGTRSGLEMVYLANARAMGPVTLQLNVGSHLPIWKTAMGLAYMVAMLPSARDELVEQLVRHEPDNEKAIRASLDDAMTSSHAHGFVCSFGTYYSYINAVGVAFRPTDGSQLVALTCGGIVDLLPREDCVGKVGDALLETVRQLQHCLEHGQT
ncbi:MAG TPA: IclR family transcriptional regulator [Ensifer sp.]|nr:IclR family transcriptional regulator [Ensifer sp.]